MSLVADSKVGFNPSVTQHRSELLSTHERKSELELLPSSTSAGVHGHVGCVGTPLVLMGIQ